MGTNISRRQFNLMLGAAAATSMGKVFAADKPHGKLVVGTWGGDYGKFLRNYIITPFLDPQGITTALAVAQESPRKIKLLAERRLPHGTMDTAALTFGGMFQMWQNDVLQKLDISRIRSEEHTSELQLLMRISYAVFCLKKKHTKHTTNKPAISNSVLIRTQTITQ